MKGRRLIGILGLLAITTMSFAKPNMFPTKDNGKFFVLSKKDLAGGPHHLKHNKIFGRYAKGYNSYVLKAIDKVQASQPEGGGYFIGLKALPPESPIGYNLSIFGRELLKAPRTTSYCSGSSYTVFIETMNLMFPKKDSSKLSFERYEALRMQELDGSRREDDIKFWGIWNTDGFGTNFALVQYSGIGRHITPEEARPGDFVNISWKSGVGHSVVFLGWYINEKNEKEILYFSSQKGTNGLGDQEYKISAIKEVSFVRITNPENIFRFDPATKVDKSIKGDPIRL